MLMYIIRDSENENVIAKIFRSCDTLILKGEYLVFENVNIRVVGIISNTVHVFKGEVYHFEIFLSNVVYTDKTKQE